MTLFGLNLRVVCKDLNISIQAKGTYRMDAEHGVTLYDMPNPNLLLNLPLDYLKRFNSWMHLPGEWRGSYDTYFAVTIRKHEIWVPQWSSKTVSKATDLFEFLHKYYPPDASYLDIIFTVARINRIKLGTFLDKFGTKW